MSIRWLNFNDLTNAEKEQVKETYICIREQEEDRKRSDVTSNPDYNYPLTSNNIGSCKFERMENGYIYVDI